MPMKSLRSLSVMWLLLVRAACPGVSASGPSTRVDDAASAGLDYATRRDYFTLRSRIDIANRQINGLQDYVRRVCLSQEEK